MTEEVDLEEILQLFTEEEKKGIGKHLLEELGKPENQVRLLTRTIDDLNKKCLELIADFDSKEQHNSELIRHLEKLEEKLDWYRRSLYLVVMFGFPAIFYIGWNHF